MNLRLVLSPMRVQLHQRSGMNIVYNAYQIGAGTIGYEVQPVLSNKTRLLHSQIVLQATQFIHQNNYIDTHKVEMKGDNYETKNTDLRIGGHALRSWYRLDSICCFSRKCT